MVVNRTSTLWFQRTTPTHTRRVTSVDPTPAPASPPPVLSNNPALTAEPVSQRDLLAVQRALLEMDSYQPILLDGSEQDAALREPLGASGWSRMCLVGSLAVTAGAVAGAMNLGNLKIVGILFQSTLPLAGLAVGLLLASIALSRQHQLTRLALGLVCLIALGVAGPTLLMHLPPASKDQILSSSLGLEAISAKTSDESRWSITIREDLGPSAGGYLETLKNDVTGRRYVIGCVYPVGRSDQVAGITWVASNRLTVSLKDRRTATVTVTQSGRATSVDDRFGILERPGTFGC